MLLGSFIKLLVYTVVVVCVVKFKIGDEQFIRSKVLVKTFDQKVLTKTFDLRESLLTI